MKFNVICPIHCQLDKAAIILTDVLLWMIIQAIYVTMAMIALSILITIYDLYDENVQQSYEDISYTQKILYGKMTKNISRNKTKNTETRYNQLHNYIDVNKASYKQIDNNRDM